MNCSVSCCYHDVLPLDVGSQGCSQGSSHACSRLNKYKQLQA